MKFNIFKIIFGKMDKKGRPFPKILVEQWHEKNEPMENYCLGSNKKVWWRHLNKNCGTVHEWKATIYSKTGKNPSNCSVCCNRQICPCLCNSLWTLRSDLRKEWNEEKNGSMKEYSLNSRKKVWWRHLNECRTVHEWKAAIYSRTRKNFSRCSICYNKKICPCLCNSLWCLKSDLRKEWNEEKNGSMKEYSLGSSKKVWWRHLNKKCGTVHEWEAAIYHRTRKNFSNCSICCNRQICPCLCNSLWTLRSDLRKEWNEKKNGSMKDYSLGSRKKVWWKHISNKCGTFHEWEAVISSRTGKKHKGCSICCNRQICPCLCNSLWSLKSELRKEWNEKKNGSMKEYSLYSNKKVWWRHVNKKYGIVHKWKATIKSRTGKKPTRCSICSSSYLETSFYKACKSLEIKNVREYSLNSIPEISSRRFDFYIKPKSLIEMDGAQHFSYVHYFHRNQKTYEKRLQTELNKSIYSWKHGYSLLRISYTIDHKDISEIIKNFVKIVSSGKRIHQYYASKDECISITGNLIVHDYCEENLTEEAAEVLKIYSNHAENLHKV